MLSPAALRALDSAGQGAYVSADERHHINRLIVAGQLDAARCIERLILDGCTVLLVEIGLTRPVVTILPPRAETGLWTSGATFKSVQAGAKRVDTWCADRFGCCIQWTVEEMRP